MRNKRRLGLLLLAAWPLAFPATALALGEASYVTTSATTGSFPLVTGGQPATLWVDQADWAGVIRAVADLQADVRRVTGQTPAVVNGATGAGRHVVLIGTVGKSPLIDRLVQAGKIDVSAIRGKWEAFFLQTVADPLPGIADALVIAGSDKRGTIYGIYDLSEQIGVSPWYWWADVPPAHQDALFITAGRYGHGEPGVKYRGIFLNDERPDLDAWVREKFGEHPTPGGGRGTVANFDSQFYTKLFELILRLRGNYLWPAMWNNAFTEDDPANPRLADEYGIVMGTSHQEPMLRAQKEWDWHDRPQYGNWNYATHPDVLNKFWREGIRAQQGLREHLHDRPARRERHRHGAGPAGEHATARADRRGPAPDARRGDQSGRDAGPAGLVALQGGAGLLRERHARARRRDPALGRGQLGQHPPPADAPRSAGAAAAPASTTTSTTTADRAATSGSTPSRSRRSGTR